MSSTVVHPTDQTLSEALRLAVLFAAIKFVLHLITTAYTAHLGYGIFRDEFYYIACGQHLAWGYVDHGPIVALQARLATALFGHSISGLRLFAALAGAARVFLTGLIAWSLNGRRPAQSLAMLCVLIAPQYLGGDSYLSMNAFESLFWMTCTLAVILIQRRVASGNADTRNPWLLFGLSAGIGLLNKPSMTFFLLSLLAALLLTPQRKLLFTRWTAAAIALTLLITLPNLLWQIHNHWPTLEFLRNGQLENKNVKLSPIAFILQQVLGMNPVTALIWIPGLVTLLRNKRREATRYLGLSFVIFFIGMVLIHAKDYYVIPIYPILFAAGAIAWERTFAYRLRVRLNSAFAFPAAQLTLVATAILILPMSIPVLAPDSWVRYTKAMHLYNASASTENQQQGPLPQFFADRFGWQQEVAEVTRIYNSLSPADKQKAAIYCSNYGEASAINTLSTGLPVAISGHNNYFLWGPNGATGEVTIYISSATPAELLQSYGSVTIAGHMDHPLSMPYEHRNIYLLRNRKKNLAADWPEFKHYI